ncbi:MAG: response regulator transcription factor [Rhizomicrobium sp.]
MRVLVIDDNPAAAEDLRAVLRSEGYGSYLCSVGEEAIDLARRYEYDAIILEQSLSGKSRNDILRALRAAHVGTPVLVLSGDAAISARVAALSLGADDCLARPYHKVELIARLRAIIRRSRAHAQSLITIGSLSIDLEAKTARVSGVEVPLTTMEYQMLEFLALRKGRTLSKSTLLEHLYDGRDEPCITTINVFICKLRKKLTQANPGESYIRTVWARGYQLCDPAAARIAA